MSKISRLSMVVLLCGGSLELCGQYAPSQTSSYGGYSPSSGGYGSSGGYNSGGTTTTQTTMTPEQLQAQMDAQRQAYQQQQQQNKMQSQMNAQQMQMARMQASQAVPQFESQMTGAAAGILLQGTTAGIGMANQYLGAVSSATSSKIQSATVNNGGNCRYAAFFLTDVGGSNIANMLTNGTSTYSQKYAYITNAFQCNVPQFCTQDCEGHNKAQWLWETVNKPRWTMFADYQTKMMAYNQKVADRIGRYCATPPVQDPNRPVACLLLCTPTTAPNCYAKAQQAGILQQFQMQMANVQGLVSKLVANQQAILVNPSTPVDTVSVQALSSILMPNTYVNADVPSQNPAVEVPGAMNYLFPTPSMTSGTTPPAGTTTSPIGTTQIPVSTLPTLPASALQTLLPASSVPVSTTSVNNTTQPVSTISPTIAPTSTPTTSPVVTSTAVPSM